MLVAVDIDGAIDAYPRELQSLMSALMAAGHRVHILTATSGDEATEHGAQTKVNYLNNLGMGECWHRLVEVDSDDVPTAKVNYMTDAGADVFIDNDEANCAAAAKAGIPLVLMPWQSRQ